MKKEDKKMKKDLSKGFNEWVKDAAIRWDLIVTANGEPVESMTGFDVKTLKNIDKYIEPMVAQKLNDQYEAQK